MALKLTEVAKARRRLATEHKRMKAKFETPRAVLNTNARPIFSSVRSITA